MLIGLSMSQCVRDIANGSVPVEAVAYIVSAAYPDDNALKLEAMFERYEMTGGAWDTLPTARAIFAMLYNSNRVIFPRNTVQGDQTSVLNIAHGHWLDSAQVNSPHDEGKGCWPGPEWEADDQLLSNDNINAYIAAHDERWYVDIYNNGEVHMFEGSLAEHGAYNSVITEDGVRRRRSPHATREQAVKRARAYLTIGDRHSLG